MCVSKVVERMNLSWSLVILMIADLTLDYSRRYSQALLSLVELLRYCALIGQRLQMTSYKRVFTIKNPHGPGGVFFAWQRTSGGFLATTGYDQAIHIYNRSVK